LEKALVDRIKTAVRQQLSARHVPEIIVQVPDIPVCYFFNDPIILHIENFNP
jgi:hypothetical protein